MKLIDLARSTILPVALLTACSGGTPPVPIEPLRFTPVSASTADSETTANAFVGAARDRRTIQGATRPGAPITSRPSTATPPLISRATAASRPPATVGFPTATPGPAALLIDLADAQATAIAWSGPGQAPRIVRAAYLDAAAGAIEALRSLRGLERGLYLYDAEPADSALEWWLTPTPLEEPRQDQGGPLIMVELSQLGMDILGVGEFQGFTQAERPGPCEPVPRNARYTITAFFDARSGRFIGQLFGLAPEPLWSVTSGYIEYRRVTATPSATPSPPGPRRWPTLTPRPTSMPLFDAAWQAEPLAQGEYPRGVSKMIHVWPLVEGSWWSYRVTTHYNGRDWHTEVITETVVNATRRGLDVMVVEIGTEGGETRPWDAGVFGNERIIIGDRVMTAEVVTVPLTNEKELVASSDPVGRLYGNFIRPPVTSMYSIARVPLRTGDQYNYWWRSARTRSSSD